MANSVCEVLLIEAPLKAPRANTEGKSGAIVDFWGVVRQLEDGHEIEGIDYEAHTAMAEHQLGLVGSQAVEKFQLDKVVVHHRVGFVPTGEASLYVEVRAQHRGVAFDASKWIVDELKRKVPIWKRPQFRIDNPRRPGSPILATTSLATK